ncbi:uncharacterized protein L3040_003833 [Drepanopeziza brunnea f. sp. 'multigermtubi']|uniref:Uncharacterized protein n=1 Tax=Marssonina brunnea f. sp. multigermtubi (strain MB_m1) TaxID=1072389 RepID=K1WC63_MARBU|nr:uncharacterized protein MBM_06731 [Drepanopeziza brunnea f. sp. 'multigermtubi' MB_m1]EKD14970.1 hypothetical protein MBM_06731 [Drepanopeziza brunnea f. sp. 'multigermtubi' MB_m1]KAJ5046594.1 hypothetical protein L3040_003833 [Drepanopeziza brunnea f. sp. 'multigermtubi']
MAPPTKDSSSTAKEALPEKKKIPFSKGSTANRISNSSIKHAPCCPRGTKFSWSANMHLSLANTPRPQVGVESPELMHMNLTDTKGNTYRIVYPGRGKMDFSSRQWVSALDKWRRQFINRRLNKNNDGESQANDFRPHWTEPEQEYLLHVIKEWIKKNECSISMRHWEEIAGIYNARFEGTEAQAGWRCPPAFNGKGLSAGGKLKLAHTLPARKATAVRSQVYRWPRVREAMDAELRKIEQEDNGDDDDREDVDLEAPDSDDEDALDSEDAYEPVDDAPHQPQSSRLEA